MREEQVNQPLHCCYYCSYKYDTLLKLNFHIRTRHYVSQTCSKCCFTTLLKKDLLNHIKSFHQNNNLICNQCSFSASNEELLLNHFKKYHDKVTFSCQYCRYVSPRKPNVYKLLKNRNNHLKYVHGKYVKTYYPNNIINIAYPPPQKIIKNE